MYIDMCHPKLYKWLIDDEWHCGEQWKYDQEKLLNGFQDQKTELSYFGDITYTQLFTGIYADNINANEDSN